MTLSNRLVRSRQFKLIFLGETICGLVKETREVDEPCEEHAHTHKEWAEPGIEPPTQ